jgi:hypothetical protein
MREVARGNINANPGDIITVDKELAKDLIDSGAAVTVAHVKRVEEAKAKAKAEEQAKETAEAEAEEQAIEEVAENTATKTGKGKGRKRGK